MFAAIWDELGVKGVSVLLGLIVGSAITWLLARWKRISERRSVLRGDARDTVVIAYHVVESEQSADGHGAKRVPRVLRIRSLGQGQLNQVIPNGHLASVLHDRAHAVTPRDTLISMAGAEGSYLLETLTNFVCDHVANEPFEHDLYVMAPCCEPAGLAEHQPVTVLLIAVKDLQGFENWTVCRDVLVEHTSDGARILTLMEMARRFKHEQEELARLRQVGQRTRYVETMYMLDLSLDKRAYPIATKRVAWGRFEELLREMNLETERPA